MPGAGRDGPPRADAACKRHAADARIIDDAACLVMADEQVGVGTRRRTRFLPQPLECERALRHALGVLHQNDIARHQVRPREPRELVVREVPWLHSEEHADRRA